MSTSERPEPGTAPAVLTMAQSRARIPKKGSKGARTQQRILDAALELFAESGFNAVSLREIAARAEITHVGLLHHFANKDEILMRIMVSRDITDEHSLREQLTALHEAQKSSEDPLIDLRWYLDHLHRITTQPHMIPLYVKISSEATDPAHPAHQHFVTRYETAQELISDSIARTYARLGMTTPLVPADQAAQHMVALSDGLQIQWEYAPETVNLERSILTYLGVIGLPVETTTR
ncbi:TetR/AcrR family transcriptional regulator [Mycetocola sp. JXN-3]|uniref:TetR/AcrR family transcriptional regulator n=1 Tax=Mycetocola sp. JXN-3 TaxID=2116510 RepID=UPI00165D2A2C|nr:TetR/AcrR family transcriptional regulator [Mycetocola sp. JXN-3]